MRNMELPEVTVSRGVVFVSKDVDKSRRIESRVLQHALTAVSVLVFALMAVAVIGTAAAAWITATGRPIAAETLTAIRGTLGLPLLIFLVYVSGTVHEAGHAVAAWAEGVPVNKSGVMFLFGMVPLGFFVKIDDHALVDAPLSSQVRILAAGIGVNLAVVMVTLSALFVGSSSSLQTMLAAVTQTPFPLGHATWITCAWATVVANAVIVAFNVVPLAHHDGGHLLRAVVHRSIDVHPRDAVDSLTSLVIVPCILVILFAAFLV